MPNICLSSPNFSFLIINVIYPVCFLLKILSYKSSLAHNCQTSCDSTVNDLMDSLQREVCLFVTLSLPLLCYVSVDDM